MPILTHVTPNVATASQLDADDFAQIAALGFKSVINNRPDAEEGGLISSNAAREAALKAGLSYAYIPASGHALFEDDVLDGFDRALREMPGPVLIHCHTGTRSAILWAMVSARTQPVSGILATVTQAGLDINFLEPQLLEQSAAYRGRVEAGRPAVEIGIGPAGSHIAPAPQCDQSSAPASAA